MFNYKGIKTRLLVIWTKEGFFNQLEICKIELSYLGCTQFLTLTQGLVHLLEHRIVSGVHGVHVCDCFAPSIRIRGTVLRLLILSEKPSPPFTENPRCNLSASFAGIIY